MKQTKFQTFPAIDIIDGKCVRLKNGDYSIKSDYEISPVAQAKIFKKSGFKNLHIIDLDGAKDKSPVNIDLIKEIVSSSGVYIQVGGGIRTASIANEYLDVGVNQVIISSAIFDERFEWDKVDTSKITASLDLKSNKICINGWLDSVKNSTRSVIQKLETIGIKRIIVTDISKDGTLGGPNVDLAKNVKMMFNGKVLLAGGVRDQNDIEDIKMSGLDGVVVGKALYEV